MSRYIDADNLKERIPKDIHEDVFENCSNCELLDDEQVKELIDLQPTADVVEVVRCKDCKYRSKEWYEDKRHKDGGYWLVCCENDAIAERIYGLAQDNDYCSYGERADT